MIIQAICRGLGLGKLVAAKGASAAEVTEGISGIHVTEGIGGRWHYHLSKPGVNGTGLCGAKTMYTSVPLSSWGFKGHLNETYCQKCAKAGALALLRGGAER
jgi:hypothetical protein